MSHPIRSDPSLGSVEARITTMSPDEWEPTDIRLAENLTVRLELTLDRDAYTLLAQAAQQAEMPLTRWIKHVTQEQARRLLGDAALSVAGQTVDGTRER